MIDYTNPENRIKENLSVDYNINTIPTLIVEKPPNENIALNFPSVDLVEKPSNKFSLSIDNIIADTDNFDDADIIDVYTDDGMYSRGGDDWIVGSDTNVRVDENYMTISGGSS